MPSNNFYREICGKFCLLIFFFMFTVKETIFVIFVWLKEHFLKYITVM